MISSNSSPTFLEWWVWIGYNFKRGAYNSFCIQVTPVMDWQLLKDASFLLPFITWGSSHNSEQDKRGMENSWRGVVGRFVNKKEKSSNHLETSYTCLLSVSSAPELPWIHSLSGVQFFFHWQISVPSNRLIASQLKIVFFSHSSVLFDGIDVLLTDPWHSLTLREAFHSVYVHAFLTPKLDVSSC